MYDIWRDCPYLVRLFSLLLQTFLRQKGFCTVPPELKIPVLATMCTAEQMHDVINYGFNVFHRTTFTNIKFIYGFVEQTFALALYINWNILKCDSIMTIMMLIVSSIHLILVLLCNTTFYHILLKLPNVKRVCVLVVLAEHVMTKMGILNSLL